MELGTKDNPRVFDVHVPREYEEKWTVKLIEHLCRMEDERCRLRAALQKISADARSGKTIADEALKQCYHCWLVASDTTYRCSICKKEINKDELASHPDPAPA